MTTKTKRQHWMETSSSEWTPATMKSFINAQNGYSYDGEPAMTHSCISLFRFADLPQEQFETFSKVYSKIYK